MIEKIRSFFHPPAKPDCTRIIEPVNRLGRLTKADARSPAPIALLPSEPIDHWAERVMKEAVT